MAAGKGALLEEVVRAYFAKQSMFAIRSLPLRFGGEDVTDVDIWVYARQSASVRTRAVVDVKNKKTPRALERILWTKGLQALTGADRAIVVTTDGGPHVVRFGQEQKVTVLTKAFLTRLEKTLPLDERISWEDLVAGVRSYGAQKTDGDWLRRLEDAKSGLVSTPGFPAFNRALSAFAFFAERVESRPHHAEQAMRCALLCAAVACVSLDIALERVVFADAPERYRAIVVGVTYGDTGDGRVQRSIEQVLGLIEQSMENGRVVARQARENIDRQFASVRAEVLAEFFSREHNAAQLVMVARDLEACAHSAKGPRSADLTAEARATVGVFADFVQVRRQLVLGTQSTAPLSRNSLSEGLAPESSGEQPTPEPGKLL